MESCGNNEVWKFSGKKAGNLGNLYRVSFLLVNNEVAIMLVLRHFADLGAW